MDEQILRRLAACEAANRRLRRILIVQGILWLSAFLALGASCASVPARASKGPTSLRASELVVVDRKGVERVRISGDLPDAVIAGKRVPRGSQAAGVLLYDDTGQERSGYVTFSPSGNVGLTLDTRQGQVALFAADAEGGAALRLWNAGDEIALRADEDGAHVTGVAAKKVIFQEPPITSPESSATCTELRKLKGKFSDSELFAACTGRLREEACRACLSRP